MPGSVYGNVVRAQTGEPVAGATVVCGKGSATRTSWPPEPAISTLTDGAGWFRFENLTAGEWLLRIHGAGRYSLTEAAVSVFDNALSEATLEIVSHSSPDLSSRPVSRVQRTLPRGNVRGRVVDMASGAPIGYASVVVVSGSGPVPDYVFVASSTGWFELDDVPVGEWLLRARNDDGATGIATVRVMANALTEMAIAVDGLPATDWPEPAIEPFYETQEHRMIGRLIGQVIDADNGRPVADATVNVLRGPGQAPDIAPVTDRNGNFALDGLPAGSWLLRAVGPNGETGLVQASVRPGSITQALIRLTGNPGHTS
jgi:hypothetical protein